MHIRILSYSFIKYIYPCGLHTFVDNFSIFKWSLHRYREDHLCHHYFLYIFTLITIIYFSLNMINTILSFFLIFSYIFPFFTVGDNTQFYLYHCCWIYSLWGKSNCSIKQQCWVNGKGAGWLHFTCCRW